MSLSVDDLEAHRKDCCALIASRKSLLLASRDGDQPEVSYAPYIKDSSGFYIFTSELARHTLNLLRFPKAGVMFIQDEADSQNLFARQRVTFDCDVSIIAPSDQRYEALLQQMEQQLGNVVGVLRSLSDFRLFRLQPSRGRYVVGFGKAFEIDVADGSLSAIDADAVARSKRES